VPNFIQSGQHLVLGLNQDNSVLECFY